VSLLVEAEEAVDAASPAATSARSALRVVDSFVVPRFHYDPIKKVFYEYVHTRYFFLDLENWALELENLVFLLTFWC
jgi:hypothetical protein